jgi:GntR family transcriptional regulator
MSLASPSPVPLYHQVHTVLRQRVVDGTYAPGERLAPEDELAAEFGVSRATIRQAVGELVKDRLVTRQQGRGTFVADNVHELLGHVFRGNLDDMIASGEVRKTKLRGVSVRHQQAAPRRVIEVLGLDGTLASQVRRTRILDGVAFAHTVDWLPPELGPHITKGELQRKGVMQLLEQGGVEIVHGEQTIRAELADVVVSEALAVPLGSAVLYVERLLTGADDTAVLFVQSWYRGDRYEYRVTFDRGDDELGSALA